MENNEQGLPFASEASAGANIKVFGTGGAGSNAVNGMIQSGLANVEFWIANTDKQALEIAQTPNKLQLGLRLTRGLGAGGNPETGKLAAEESVGDISKALEAADMVFITCGMGGGTGTGSSEIIADVARDKGVLTVGVVTKPFSFEGRRRAKLAEEGIKRLKDKVDALIVIPNDRLLEITERQTSMKDAFKLADNVLLQAVQGISDIINLPGLINVDFADVKSVMRTAGNAIMGMGRASGEGRAVSAAKQAINSPLLENSIKGATGIIFNVTGGKDLTLHEVNEAAESIYDQVSEDANIIVGAVIDEKIQGEIQITVIATGFESIEPKQKAVANNAKEKSPFYLSFGSGFSSTTSPAAKPAASRSAVSSNNLFFSSPKEIDKSNLSTGITATPAVKPGSEMRVRQSNNPELIDIPEFLRVK